MLSSDDAKRILDRLASVESAEPGRDFVYTITKTDGSKVIGRLVDHAADQLDLVVEEDLGPTATSVSWDEIASIEVTSY